MSILPFIIIFVMCYMLYQVHRTFEQRVSLIPKPGDPEFWSKIKKHDSVTFVEHFYRNVFLRDWKKLYE